MLICIRQNVLQGTECFVSFSAGVNIYFLAVALFLLCKKAFCFLPILCHAGVTSSPMRMVKSSYPSGNPGMYHPSVDLLLVS